MTNTNNVMKYLNADISIKKSMYDSTLTTAKLSTVIKLIRDEAVKNKIEKIRLLKANGAHDKAKEVKNNLPMFYLTCYHDIAGGANQYNENSHSGLMMFDIDKVSQDESKDLMYRLFNSEFADNVVFAFLSPSGGLKFTVATDYDGTDPDFYKHCYKKLYAHLVDIGMPEGNLDAQTCNANRGTYFSADKNIKLGKSKVISLEAYRAEYSILKAEEESMMSSLRAVNEHADYDEVYANRYWNNAVNNIIASMGSGDRHLNIFKLCMVSFKCGLGIEGAIEALNRAKANGQYTESMSIRNKALDAWKSFDGIVDIKFFKPRTAQQYAQIFSSL
ncbi:BT4734/BF3469 family protein [Enterovibrio nigricans]|uniref:VirE N-terminal domain-containing protein n=1 Tax=Enterovibrio nigricans DSM 22720 TaxID=1121868 RepID=A0A1T4UE13_9GAMM|nr:BT4734/BF3469 family protein [Enterovibrio nigricans]PKF50173.1 hypothetical protein AT251_13380 [Enterovibrio nigricans]SKA50929.1 VirE N-terminal domain-containing protein [Enterovibrio nigricans DSM 22720]